MSRTTAQSTELLASARRTRLTSALAVAAASAALAGAGLIGGAAAFADVSDPVAPPPHFPCSVRNDAVTQTHDLAGFAPAINNGPWYIPRAI